MEQAKKRKWTLEKSIFRDFEPDNIIKLQECLQADIKAMKISKYVLKDNALQETLLKRYA
jgi:hypothetical protein